ncbi:MAG: B12-binding domain-containing radical SAM protein [Elusimicrobia bacterium]|nr:B12-binding domain-containing radical SAM protein [Elusimicrobiota bacterium]
MKNKSNKSVIFIEPAGNEANVFDNYMKLPLMGCLYLGTILHNAGYSVKIINENILGRRISLFELNADYLCISCLSLNSNCAKEIISNVRQIFPEIKIIAGGIHPSLLPDEFVDFADHVVVGEAESIILDVIGGKYSEKIIYGSKVDDMDTLPLINYKLLQDYRKMNIIPIMTSRGCPFDCNFCTVTKVFGRKYRMQSIKRVVEEIRNALKYFDTQDVFFYDDNLTANKKRIYELAEALHREKINILWTAQMRADVSKDRELLLKMSKAGCDKIFIGFESINDETLKALNKQQTRRDIENAISTIHSYGINIHGMFVLGEDSDTLENMEETVDFAMQHDIGTVQFMIITPIPGTKLYDKLSAENRLLHKNWDYYDGMYTVFKPKNMTPLELQQASIKSYKRFYSIERVLLKLLYLSFNIFHDIFLWDFKNVHKYDLSTFYIRIGAQYIINRYMKLNKSYFNYLRRLS